MKKEFFIFLVTAFFSLPTFSEIYRTIDADGVATYSDQPDAGSKVVTLPEANISSTPQDTVSFSTDSTDQKETTSKSNVKSYGTFEIVLPRDEKNDEENFWNPEAITVSIDIKPALREGDRIQYFLDAKPIDKPTAKTSFTFPKMITDKASNQSVQLLTRGQHMITAVVYNASLVPLNTAPPVTIYVHYGVAQ
ncbi:MAG TPA: DUF4124 domain-containing protein [Coxiellaceae bacterium]|nr:DUF4124 domain-containing protein [Coxiellaceae bacterium]